MNCFRLKKVGGYSLFELLAVIIIVGIIASVSMRSMRGSVEVSRVEETKQEMDHLAWAICGNPALISGGVRTDFGYVGDVGALPGGSYVVGCTRELPRRAIPRCSGGTQPRASSGPATRPLQPSN